MIVAFRVNGLPAPKGSFRIARKRGGKGFTVRKDSDKTETWHRLVGWAAKVTMGSAAPFTDLPLAVTVAFYLPRPKRAGARPSVKPDLDKLLRATLDPLEGIVIDQDSRVVEVSASKHYANAAEPIGAHITITEAS